MALIRLFQRKRRICEFIGGDSNLADAVMEALRNAAWRDDVPDADKTVALRSESKHSWLAYPVLASMHMLQEDDPALLDQLDDAKKRRALAIYYCVPDTRTQEAIAICHDRWFQLTPDLVLDVLYQCTVAELRSGGQYLRGLADLDRLPSHTDPVHDTRIKLLRAFPVRAPSKQLPLLDRLLGQAVRFSDTTSLAALVEKKLGTKSATDAQRVRWLTVGTLLTPEQYRQRLREFVGDSNDRTRHLAEFLRDGSDRGDFDASVLDTCTNAAVLRDMIEMLGRWCPPPGESSGWVTLEMDASWRVSKLISNLGSIISAEARQAMTDLIDDPLLGPWQDQLTWVRSRQTVALGDASYRHPSIEQVQQTLSNDLPANPADLAALVRDRLNEIALRLRGDSGNLWRQFWNEDQFGRPTGPKPEESCRDAILSQLRDAVPDGVVVEPERHYAAGTRADITVTYGGHNIPIELKKDTHPDLWTAPRAQLIDQYTTDPATDEHGIYMPLWFGPRRPQAHSPSQRSPT